MVRNRFAEILNNKQGDELHVLSIKQPQYVVINSNNHILDNSLIQILINYLSKFGISHLVNHEAKCVMFKFETKQEAFVFQSFVKSKLMELEESLIKEPLVLSHNWMEGVYKEMALIHSIITIELNEHENQREQIERARKNSIEEKMKFSKPSYIDVLNFVHHDLIRYNDESFINEVCEHYMTYTDAFDLYEDADSLIRSIAEMIKNVDLRKDAFDLFNIMKPLQMVMTHHEKLISENEDTLKDLIQLSKHKKNLESKVYDLNYHTDDHLNKINSDFKILKYISKDKDAEYDFSDYMCNILTAQINNPDIYQHVFENNKTKIDVRKYMIDDIVGVLSRYFAAQEAWNILISIKRIVKNIEGDPLPDLIRLQEKIFKMEK